MIERTAGGSIGITTNVVVRVWDLDWNLISEHRSHNTWTTGGLNVLRNWLSGNFSARHITHIAWVDTGGTERARDLVTQRVITTDKVLLIRQFLPSASSANGYTLNTIKAYNASIGGVEFASDVFDAVGISKTSSTQITVEWTHTFADGGI
jgi:hypothetical protein